MIRIIDAAVKLNFIVSVIVLAVFAMMFGVLTESLADALMFPRALYSMVLEGDLWAIWVVLSFFVWFCWIAVKRRLLQPTRPQTSV